MPIHKSAVKRMRISQKRGARNVALQSELKTVLHKVNGLLSQKPTEETKEALRLAISKLDNAAGKGIIHKKTASRKKSRLTKKLNKLLAT